MPGTHRLLIVVVLLLAALLAFAVHALRDEGSGSAAAGTGAGEEIAIPVLPEGLAPLADGPSLAPLSAAELAAADEAERALVELRATIDVAETDFADEMVWTGRVRDRLTEEPVEAVEVLLRGGAYVSRAESDEDGEFTLPWSRNLAASLRLSHPAYVDLNAPAIDVEIPGEFLLPPSASIAGRIVPLVDFEGAKVLAWRETASSRRYWESLSAEIEGDGTFRLEDLTEGDYAVTAVVPGMFVGLEMGIHVESGEEASVLLEACAGAAVGGRLFRADTRAGIPGGTVRIEPRADGLPWAVHEARSAGTESIADGSFELIGLSPGRHRLVARTPWGAERRIEISIPESGSRVEQDFGFAGPVRLSGYVVDGEGHGVQGATVLALPGSDRLGALGTLERGLGEHVPITTSGAGGFYALDGLPAQQSLLVAAFPPDTALPGQETEDSPRGLPGLERVKSIEAGKEQTDVVVTLPPRFAVEGLVLTIDGDPLPDATVFAEYRQRKRTIRAGAASVNEDGEFRLAPLYRGTPILRAWAEGHLSQTLPVQLGEEDVVEVEFQLVPSLTVEGLALDENGFGVPNIPIGLLIEKGTPVPPEHEGRRNRHNAATDAYGRFRFEGLFDVPWKVTGGSYEWQMTGADPPVVIPSRESFTTVTFAPRDRLERFSIEGRIALLEGGVPTGVRITGLRGGVLEVNGGRFVATGLTPTRHRLRIFADGHVPRTVGPIDPLPGKTVNVGTIDLAPATRLTVRVQTGKGKPVEKARVILVPLPVSEDGLGEAGSRLTLEDQKRGRYRHSFVPRCAWRLVVSHPKLGKHAQKIEIGNDASRTIKVTLK